MSKKLKQKNEMDKIDRQVIAHLQADPQQSYRKLARTMKISATTISGKIRKLEETGIIRGYAALPDLTLLGYDLTAIIFIQVNGGFLEEVEADLSKRSNVVAIYEISGDFDIVALVKVQGRDGLNLMIKELLASPHVKKSSTSISLSVVKEDFSLDF